MCILALWKLCGFLWDCGLPVDFQWSINTLEMKILEAEDGAVVGVVRLLPYGLASGPFENIK